MEREFLSWLIREQRGRRVPGLLVDVGDDAAAFETVPSSGEQGGLASPAWVVTTDGIADGSHFDWNKHPLRQIGHKAMAVNLSDLAAMAAAPAFALVTLHLPELFELKDVRELYEGIEATARQHGCHIIGGDTNRWAGRLVISVTAIGRASPGPGGTPHLCLKSEARPGDVVFVTGPLGGSILGRHLTFEPRVDLALRLNQQHAIHAMTDISDSLALDLGEMAEASGVGFTVEAERIPIAESAQSLASTCPGMSALEHALYDGEDFELVFTVDANTAAAIEDDPDLGQRVFRIGVIDESPGARIMDRDGGVRQLPIRGYEH